MKRYHPILVVIHWVMLVLIVMAWTSGQFVLEHTPNSDPGKIDALRMHMTVGLIAGALLVLRIDHQVAQRTAAPRENRQRALGQSRCVGALGVLRGDPC